MSITIATIINPIVGRYVNQLADFVEGRACMILGVKGQLQKLQRRLTRIKAVLSDAEKKGSHDAAISTWLNELKDFMYDADDIIDLCTIEGHKLLEDPPSTSLVRCHSALSCLTSTPFRYKIAIKIRDLNSRLKEIIDDSVMSRLVPTNPQSEVRGVETLQTTPMLVESDIVGTEIEESTQSLAEAIIKEEGKKCGVFAILGMGGIGKTTLASKVYNNGTITSRFPIRIWVCVTKRFNERELLREIIRSAGGCCGERESRAQLTDCLASILTQRFLLVLDDVWTDVWEAFLRIPFENGAAGGGVLITTRDETVARSMKASVHHVGKMNKEDGWAMICNKVFGDGEEGDVSGLRDIGMKIVDKCDGLPLAFKAIAGVLRTKERSRREWERVLGSQAWSMSHLPDELRGALYLSYEDLSANLKQCFLFCSLLPEGHVMYFKALVRYWMAEGFLATDGDVVMEDLGMDYYMELIGRSLLQAESFPANNRVCTMHDLLRSLGRLLAQEENTRIDAQNMDVNLSTKIRRLSVTNITERTVVTEAIVNQKCLRTLMFLHSPEITIEIDRLVHLKRLRILDLSGTEIESLPDSIGNLVHLRFICLNQTRIRKLPKSLGSLLNLQTLKISSCAMLHKLPEGITRLHNLRCLEVVGTPLWHMPKGVGKLKNMTHLGGFIVGNGGSEHNRQEGCGLEELQWLSQLRFLRMDKLEGAKTGTTVALANHSFLQELILACSPTTFTQEAIQRIEEVFQELSPPQNLQKFRMEGYFGYGFPSWMISSTLGSSFHSLTTVMLVNCKSCVQLPPLGQLPQLTHLLIQGADAIVRIGPEFLGCSLSSAMAFPKLEYLTMLENPNLEEWYVPGDDGKGPTCKPPLLQLKRLEVVECPKLRSLPECLRHASNMKELIIRDAIELREVQNLPAVQDITVQNNPGLMSLSNLPVARDVFIEDCPRLECVENLGALRRLTLECLQPTMGNDEDAFDESLENQFSQQGLPKWLRELVKERRQGTWPHYSDAQQDLELFLMCPRGMFLRCLKDAPDWHVVELVSQFAAWTNDGSNLRLSYTRMPFTYTTNLPPELQQCNAAS